jgi:uncharacterized protein (TIGR03435 family)
VNLQPAPDSAASDDDLNLMVLDAVEKQLGLKVETIKAQDTILVIDRVERPSAN